ncbi:MAG: TerC family protein [Gammaproteobacteria bacterium]|nr:TerC family protein [Gammaproteobacteria bacterium]
MSPAEISAFLQVILVDLVLAGDNAIVIGMVAAGLPVADRKKVIVAGIVAATVMRILFAAVTVKLLQIVGLVLAGGLLLLWVCWKLWREIQEQREHRKALTEAPASVKVKPTKTMRQAVIQIVIADLSMSLDNVLAVAGIARDHMWVLVFGLALSVALMGFAATWIAGLLERHHWIAYVGLLVIFYVAVSMIIDGVHDVTVWAEAG